ncbi:hypothetical protein [Methylocaldum sp.]|uniref:hypothetical protein n=1 Tax=Methylocaldum sp. TaxID=1969727 RepID=UPI002D38BC53|nr:hypothetical protein [Methylocaldum sp.]HYE34388.1 hypothetical protein [Methylocaldum sp.]
MDFLILIDLYRSTFVRNLQDRFQSMLIDLNFATTAQDAEGFDSALRDHLSDVCSDICLDRKALSESFARELLGSFVRFLEQTGVSEPDANGDADECAAWQTDKTAGYERTFSVDENLARAVREVEFQHRQSIRCVNEVYSTLVGRAPEALPDTPWRPAAVLGAFSAVLDQIEVPIHQKVRLVLRGKFIRDVLRHLDEACLAFRNGLNDRLVLGDTRGELSAGATGLTPQFLGEIAPGRKRVTDASDYGSGEIGPKKGAEIEDKPEKATEPDAFHRNRPRRRWQGRYAHVLAFSLLTMLLAAVAWQLGTRLAEHRHGSVAQNENHQRNEAPSLGKELTPPESASPGVAVEESVPPPNFSDQRAKREVIRAVELIDYNWTLEPVEKAMLFNFSIRNASERRISGVEVICLQYSENLELLETLKTVLPGTIEPNTSKDFTNIPAGFANESVDRVSCIIPDLNLE